MSINQSSKWANLLAWLLMLIIMSCGGLSPAVGAPAASGKQDIHNRVKTDYPVIPDQYIVTIKEKAFSAPARDKVTRDREMKALGGRLNVRYGARMARRWIHGLQGFKAQMSAQQAESLSRDPDVLAVEPDRWVKAQQIDRDTEDWHLDRINQRDLPLDGRFGIDHDGDGVTAFMLDSGIMLIHNEFEGRASWGINVTGDGIDTDCSGHGTHVAALMGGKTHGVAVKASMVAVKVLGCTGLASISTVLEGIEWVIQERKTIAGPVVVNMSLGTSDSLAFNQAVARLVAENIIVVVAAGNDSGDACDYSPGSAPEVITVAATRNDDRMWTNSNQGSCVDMLAPGHNLRSAGIAGVDQTAVRSGTSMASPLVAGAAAAYLSAHPESSVASVRKALQDAASAQKVSGISGSTTNELLYVGVNDSFSLHVQREGLGRIVSQSDGIDCGERCSNTYAANTGVVLSAIPAAGYRFEGWQGDICSGTDTCSLNMDQTYRVTARFSFVSGSDERFPNQGVWPQGWVTPGESALPWVITSFPVTEGGYSMKSGSIGHDQKTVLEYSDDFQAGDLSFDWTVSSEPAIGSTYYDHLSLYVDGVLQKRLAGCTRWDSTCWQSVSVSVNEGLHRFTWVYEKDSVVSGGFDSAWLDNMVLPVTDLLQHTLEVTLQGAGRVKAASPHSFDCASLTCTDKLSKNDLITLQAIADPGMEFKGWSGDCIGSGNCDLRMSKYRQVTAEFGIKIKNPQAPLQVHANPPGLLSGASAELSVTGGSGVGAVTYSASGTKDLSCVVEGSRLRVEGETGECLLEAHKEGDQDYLPAKSPMISVGVTNTDLIGLYSAVLPSARVSRVGVPVTAFAALINASNGEARDCSLSLPAEFGNSMHFDYQTTNSNNELTGSVSTPVNIPKGGLQNFLFSMVPKVEFSALDIPIVFDCRNTRKATVQTGLNTFLISATSRDMPDMVAISATATKDGVLRLSGKNNMGAFSAAAINIGNPGNVKVSVVSSQPNVVSTICSTNSKGICKALPADMVSLDVKAGEVLTFSIFAYANEYFSDDYSGNRITLNITSGGVLVGASSVAITVN